MFLFNSTRKQEKEFDKFIKELKHYMYYNDDILSEEEKSSLNKLVIESKLVKNSSTINLKEGLKRQKSFYKALVPTPSFKVIRDWLDILAVGIAVAFGIRALFFQPFKIPTSSMQPTLFGIHYIEKNPVGNSVIGKTVPVVDNLLFGSNRAYLKLNANGKFEGNQEGGFLSTSNKIKIGPEIYTLPGTMAKIQEYTNINPYLQYKKDAVLADGFLSTGDHLFVDRISHYLSGLKRGDIVVFTTEKIYSNGEELAKNSGYYYVKRLVGLPGDTLKIVDNNLFIKPEGEKEFRHIKTFSDKFDKIYSGKGGYQGHSNIVGYSTGNFLKHKNDLFVVPKDSYFMLGDNTKFSADSRIWGVVPRHNIIGKAILVFWPISRRFGIADTKQELAIPTTKPDLTTFKEMNQQ